MKSKIGWHCPYAYAAISRFEEVIPIKIEENDKTDVNDKKLKTCNNIRNIAHWLEIGELDGLILVNCCNLMNYFYEIFRVKYQDVSIVIMEIPRKMDDDSKEIVFKEWQRIEEWIKYNFIKADSSKVIKKGKSIEFKSKAAEKTDEFCNLQEHHRRAIEMLPRKKQLEYLLDQIKCPRIISSIGKDVKELELDAIDFDQNCIIQSYLSSLFKGEKKSESIKV